ncbi:formylglycine-generating enzyme family protein [Myxococcota bacterium]|nr:formylglycine-generating enzyme family protein [Myxococcota bacterium]MBU1896922.1 formylglycine-generating enzyme family protein [Myxococcota bacterium]
MFILKKLNFAFPLVLIGCFAKGIDPPEPTPMVFVQGAPQFLMGSDLFDPCNRLTTNPDPENVEICPTETKLENPRYNVRIDDFCIDQHEVTISQYRYCVEKGACNKPTVTSAGRQNQTGYIRQYYTNPDDYGDHPVIGVTWLDAAQYCDFVGGTLPLESQFEYLAKRGDSDHFYGLSPLERESLTNNCYVTNGISDKSPGLAWGACSSRTVRAVMDSSLDAVLLKNGVVSSSNTGDYNLSNKSAVYDLFANVSEWAFDEFDLQALCNQEQRAYFESPASAWWAEAHLAQIGELNCLGALAGCLEDHCGARDSEDCVLFCKAHLCDEAPEADEPPDDPRAYDARYTFACFNFGGVDLEPWCGAEAPSSALAAGRIIQPLTREAHRAAILAEKGRAQASQHVIRGGDYLDDEVCEVRASRRRRNALALPNTGFRCAYPVENRACQRDPAH